MTLSLPHPRRIIDRRFKRLVMQNERCIVLDQRFRLMSILGPQNTEPWFCKGSFEFHHIKPYGGGIMGSKVSDRRGVKVCQKHHEMAAERANFERDFRIDLDCVIAELNQKYPPTEPKQRERKKRLPVLVKRLKAWAVVNQLRNIQSVHFAKPRNQHVVRVEIRGIE